MDYEALAKGMAMAVPFAGHLNLEIATIAEGEAVVQLPERPELTNHIGTQHAGALFTVAEAASGAAFIGAFAERMNDVTPLAKRAEIDYELPARGQVTANAKLGMDRSEALERLDAEGRVEFPCQVELFAGDGTRVATATVRWHVRLKEPVG
ncbi:MAG: hypothetical protein QOI84_783 [Solirubrobacterales bacterium]|jgi:uncharacterized protein (TIGR00369 family)|nr:hypothetical protein [Solirubrobacterales bacterium]